MTSVTIQSNAGGAECGCCFASVEFCVERNTLEGDYQLIIGFTPDCSAPIISMTPQATIDDVKTALFDWYYNTVAIAIGPGNAEFIVYNVTDDGFCVRYKISLEFIELYFGQSICGQAVYNCSQNLDVTFNGPQAFQCC